MVIPHLLPQIFAFLGTWFILLIEITGLVNRERPTVVVRVSAASDAAERLTALLHAGSLPERTEAENSTKDLLEKNNGTAWQTRLVKKNIAVVRSCLRTCLIRL